MKQTHPIKLLTVMLIRVLRQAHVFHTGFDLNAWCRLTFLHYIYLIWIFLFGTTLNTMNIVKEVLGQINDINSFTFTDDEKARYVKVMLQNQNFLHLCEVQVFGYDGINSYSSSVVS
jgi:hypothetical protein